MLRVKIALYGMALWITSISLAACNLASPAASALPPSATPAVSTSTPGSPTVVPPTAIVPTDSPTAPQPSDTPLPATDTPSSPTLPPPTSIPGSAIRHFAAGQKIDITSIRMIDANQGWGIGGLSQASDHVFRTQDGGKSWHDVTPPQPSPGPGTQLQAVAAFRDASSAWVMYSAGVSGQVQASALMWRTLDGGATWQSAAVDTSVSSEAFAPSFIDFVDGLHGWLMVYLGAGMSHQYVALFATTDGGVTWNTLVTPSDGNDIQACPKTSLVFFDAQSGWITRECRGLYPTPNLAHTTDGGATWTTLNPPAPAGDPHLYDNDACDFYSPTVFSPQSVILIMGCVDLATYKVGKGYLYSTTDGGNTWQTYPIPAGFSVLEPPAGGLYFISAQSGLALSRKIFRTDDGGKSWSLAKLVNWDGQFSFLDLNVGWAVATNAGQIALVKTTDGGGTWQEIKPVVAP